MSGMVLAPHPDLGIVADGPGLLAVRTLVGLYRFWTRERF